MEQPLFTLITGASSGIGRAIAEHLSADRRLVLHGRDVNRLDETRARCVQPERHVLWQMDLASPSAIQASLPAFLTQHGLAIDGFVHCAGVMKILPMRQMELALAQDIMNVNFFSAAEIVRLLLKKNVNDRQLKNIVFISSTASKFGAKGFNLYSASKGALDSLMRSLAVELAPNIRINSILPGGIQTSMTESMFSDPQMAERLGAGYPLGLGKPSDIASAVEFLLSDKARWITGQQFVLDGGRTINISA